MYHTFPTLAGPGEPEYAVEVARLTRRFVFEAQDDHPDHLMGGHFIIMHTPGVHVCSFNKMFECFVWSVSLFSYQTFFFFITITDHFWTRDTRFWTARKARSIPFALSHEWRLFWCVYISGGCAVTIFSFFVCFIFCQVLTI